MKRPRRGQDKRIKGRRVVAFGRSGVTYHEARMQPYTVWLDGEVLSFKETPEAAEAFLVRATSQRLDLEGRMTPMLSAMVKGALVA